MVKILFLIFLFVLINNCSHDAKKITLKKKDYYEKNKKLSELKFDYNLTFDEFRYNVINYGKLSNFPKLDE
tara:strand:- start:76 stop:288 length:213 start_codon:yes stop_codon:yes gene_type:complete